MSRPLRQPAARAEPGGWLSGKIDPLPPFASWQQTHFADLPDGRDHPRAAFDFDEDGDRLANGIGYVLGSDPRGPGPGIGGGRFEFLTAWPFPLDARLAIEISDSLDGWTK